MKTSERKMLVVICWNKMLVFQGMVMPESCVVVSYGSVSFHINYVIVSLTPYCPFYDDS